MEFGAFIAGVFIVIVVVLWRGRSRTPRDDASSIEGLPDDLRDKNTGQMSLPNRGDPWGHDGP